MPLARLAPAGTLRHLQRVRRDNLSLEGKPDKMTQELERVLGTGWNLIVVSGKLKPVAQICSRMNLSGCFLYLYK